MGIGSFISSKLKQTAVYWGNPEPSGYGMESTFDTPVEVSCRWSEKRVLFKDKKGEQKVSRAVVTVDQDLDIGGFLYLGELTDLDSNPDDPVEISAAYEILNFTKIPSIDGSDNLRKAFL